MPKRILIVENDAALIKSMRGELEAAGFSVDETTDARGSQELIRRSKPDLVLLAVDLSAGQNGYIICGKLKKDDDLKSTPVVIVGNPDGFAQHRKLKTRADDYVAKPVDLKALINCVGGLIGLPEPAAAVDEGINLSELVDEDAGKTGEYEPEEIPVETSEEVVAGDPELAMLDAAFDDISVLPKDGTAAPEPAVVELDVEPPGEVAEVAIEEPPAVEAEMSSPHESFSTSEFDSVPPTPEPAPPPVEEPPAPPSPLPARASPPAASPRSSLSASDAIDLRQLRIRVSELEGTLTDARARETELEAKVSALEADLEAKTQEAEAARSATSGKNDREMFALREASNRKDKEILRLKTEVTQKESELLDLREKETTLEQQVSEAGGEIARRDAQIRTLTTKSDQLVSDRRRIDQQLAAAREEARGASARLSALQAELDRVTAEQQADAEELERLRTTQGETESRANQAAQELEELRAELQATKQGFQARLREADDMRAQFEQAQIDVESAKNQLTSQATAFAEEISGLRKRLGELEENNAKHEDRVAKLYGRIKDEEKLRDKTKKALAIALQLLEEHGGLDDLDIDEASA